MMVTSFAVCRRPLMAVILSLMTVYSGTATAADYYVSTSGNDRNAGTAWETAWRTVGHAGKRATAGDRVIIRKGGVPYDYLPVVNSGTEGKPIIFRGESAANPPVLTGGSRITRWIGPGPGGVWRAADQPKTMRVIEDDRALMPASDPRCTDGRWHWSKDRVLYYRPTSGKPGNHEVWNVSRGGGVHIGQQSWIVIENLYMWGGGGAGISVKGGGHNVFRNVRAKWHWRGADITLGSHYNLIENLLAEENSEGIYISRGSHYNTVRNCRIFRNGNLPLLSSGDRAGIAIGGRGPNVGNLVEGCEIAYNGGPDSDPALIVYQAPESKLLNNNVHDNFGSGIFVTISSDRSRVQGNIVERNGMQAVKARDKNISGLSVRRSRDVIVENNRVRDNWVAHGDRWGDREPRGGLELQGLPPDDMRGIVFRNNEVSGTVGGSDVYLSRRPNIRGIVIEPAEQAPRWLTPVMP